MARMHARITTRRKSWYSQAVNNCYHVDQLIICNCHRQAIHPPRLMNDDLHRLGDSEMDGSRGGVDAAVACLMLGGNGFRWPKKGPLQDCAMAFLRSVREVINTISRGTIAAFFAYQGRPCFKPRRRHGAEREGDSLTDVAYPGQTFLRMPSGAGPVLAVW